MASLTDLDELVLKCRDERTRTYIAEAVASYRAGAYRASIVGTWIAVCFDIIEKLRELALAGDAEAERQVADLEKTRASGDVVLALRFEKTILVTARDKFELISPLEYIDLERLQADRNRCAHPSLISEDQAYSPSAELARAHIHAGVTHLLQHPPAQGKYALERLLREIGSEYFPTQLRGAMTALESGPLRRPRESLVRNLVAVLLKQVIQEGVAGKARLRAFAVLMAARSMHPRPYADSIAAKFSPLLRALQDEELSRAVTFLSSVSDSWQYIEPATQLRLNSYVQNLPKEHLEELEFLLAFDPLREAAERRVRWLSFADLAPLIWGDMPEKVADRLVSLLLHAKSFDDANKISAELITQAYDLKPSHVKALLEGVQKNAQITGCYELPRLISALRQHATLPADEFEAMLTSNGLSEHAKVG